MCILDKENFELLCKEVNILFLSDLHYRAKEGSDEDNLEKDVNNAIVAQINKFVTDDPDWRPHVLLLGGDLVNHGLAENYRNLLELLDALRKEYPLLEMFTFATPGNHCLNRDSMVASFELLYSIKSFTPDEYETIKKDSYTQHPVIDAINTFSALDLENLKKHKLIESLQFYEKEYFKTFIKQKYDKLKHTKDCNFKIEDSTFETFYHYDPLGIEIASINSSFFCNYATPSNDRNHLFLIREVVESIKNSLQKEHKNLRIKPPVISMMHHPFYYLHESEHIYPISDSNNGGNNFLTCADFSSLILNGHTHGEFHEPTDFAQKTHIVNNGASYYHEKHYPNTFAIIKVNKQNNYFRIKRFKGKKEEQKDYEFSIIAEQLDIPYYFHMPKYDNSNNEKLANDFDIQEIHKINLIKSLYDNFKKQCNKQYKKQEINTCLRQFQIKKVTDVNTLEINNADFDKYKDKPKSVLDLLISNKSKIYISLQIAPENHTNLCKLSNLFKLVIRSRSELKTINETILYHL